MSKLMVDINQFKAWCDGILLDMHNGRGIVVNERECEEAELALLREETVLLRDGNTLTGTEVILEDGAFVERECQSADSAAQEG